LEAELEAELEARKKQYTFYRDALLSFEGKNVEWKTLGEVSKILRGTAITKKETVHGEFPVVANAPDPIYYHNKSNRSGEIIVIARSGAYSGLVSYWNQPLFLTDAFSIHPNNNLLKTKFVYYILKREQNKIHSMKKGHGVPHVRASDFESYSIPIPPLSEQQRIATILDKFDALVNDISIGLPAEIEARRKQYEYYRNRLLTFKMVSVTNPAPKGQWFGRMRK
jgi:type I restriction enzyme S subunit